MPLSEVSTFKCPIIIAMEQLCIPMKSALKKSLFGFCKKKYSESFRSPIIMILFFLIALSRRHCCCCFFADFSSSSLLLLLSITWKCPREKKSKEKDKNTFPSLIFSTQNLSPSQLSVKNGARTTGHTSKWVLSSLLLLHFIFFYSFSFSASVFFFFAIGVFDDSLWICIWVIWWAWVLDLGWVWQRKRENRLGEMKIERGEERNIKKIKCRAACIFAKLYNFYQHRCCSKFLYELLYCINFYTFYILQLHALRYEL